ncbi:MAG: TspO/MBR family protein [Candidatus Omnitrophota bacterium]
MPSFLVFLVLCFSAAAAGSLFTADAVRTWYPTLKKPSWNPPAFVFAPVWTVLYVMMATAGWLTWEHLPAKVACLPMVFFAVQLALNVGWSWLFFGLRRPGWAFFELILLWVFIFLSLLSFWGVYWVAGALFVPYLLWVSFAAVLNFNVWSLNR